MKEYTAEEFIGHMEKPKTMEEMVTQLWYCIIGTNGEGLAKQSKRVDEKVDDLILEFSSYKETRLETCPLRRSKADKVGAWVTRVAIAGGIVALVLELVGVFG